MESTMFVARWHIDAGFGQKQTVIDLLKRWRDEVGTKAGTDTHDMKILTGSVCAREATVEAHHRVPNLAEPIDFSRRWAKWKLTKNRQGS
jgi:hypothetical protein